MAEIYCFTMYNDYNLPKLPRHRTAIHTTAHPFVCNHISRQNTNMHIWVSLDVVKEYKIWNFSFCWMKFNKYYYMTVCHNEWMYETLFSIHILYSFMAKTFYLLISILVCMHVYITLFMNSWISFGYCVICTRLAPVYWGSLEIFKKEEARFNCWDSKNTLNLELAHYCEKQPERWGIYM